jgi:hypothetical protein
MMADLPAILFFMLLLILVVLLWADRQVKRLIYHKQLEKSKDRDHAKALAVLKYDRAPLRPITPAQPLGGAKKE